jgi:hypothetical protein
MFDILENTAKTGYEFSSQTNGKMIAYFKNKTFQIEIFYFKTNC